MYKIKEKFKINANKNFEEKIARSSKEICKQGKKNSKY